MEDLLLGQSFNNPRRGCASRSIPHLGLNTYNGVFGRKKSSKNSMQIVYYISSELKMNTSELGIKNVLVIKVASGLITLKLNCIKTLLIIRSFFKLLVMEKSCRICEDKLIRSKVIAKARSS
jgi:hypothetical protein